MGGNASKKLAEQCTLLTKEEQKELAATFKTASHNSSRIKEDDLIKFWGARVDPRLVQLLNNYLFGTGSERSCDFNRFAELYVRNVRGTVDERCDLIYKCLGQEEGQDIPYQLLKEYCESIVSTFIKTLKSSAGERPALLVQKGFRGRAAGVQALAEALAAAVADAPPVSCSLRHIEKWLQNDVLLRALSEAEFKDLYGVAANEGLMLPKLIGLEAMPDYPAFIDLSHVVWLTAALPAARRRRWRFLFSSHVHGESFSTMAGRILDEGPTLLIIEDKAGHIFGGYAADSWTLGPAFYGGEESFLFTLAPRLRCYPSSGYNNHYQYINMNTKTLPNGLLMGGQFEFGGIWVPADPFGGGSSAESCSTYRGYRRLAKDGNFTIKSIEVWGVGEKPLSMKESGERDTSVLDRNPEAKALLEMAGKTRHSEGLRDPDLE